MHSAHPELTAALGLMLDKLDTSIRESGYTGEPVKMYAAGGIAVHYFCGTRYTADVDATFSHRILIPFSDLVVKYQREDGRSASLYLDPTYNDHFALLQIHGQAAHTDFRVNPPSATVLEHIALEKLATARALCIGDPAT